VHAFCHFGKWHDIEVEDDVTAYLEYPNGATGVFITTTGDTPGSNRFEITGTLGKLVYENDCVTFTRLLVDEREHCKTAKGGFVRPKEEEVAVRLVGENTQHIGILNNVANAILGYEELYAKAEEGIHGVALANAMHLSAWENRTVDMPVDGDAFLRHLNERIATSTVRKDNVVDKVDGSINYGESQPRK
jgi:predicted dehydrogenase